MSRHAFVVEAEEAGQRLDRVLVGRLPERTRSALTRAIRAGGVLVDGVAVKPGQLLRAGASVEVSLPEPPPTSAAAESIPLHILFEDEAILVLDKPPGLVVHPAAGHAGGTLVNALLGHLGGLPAGDEPQKPGIVHRLDKDTSGVLVVAKTERAMVRLQRQFAARRVGKSYLALVLGCPEVATGRIEARVGRSRRDRTRMRTLVSGGREAMTRWHVLEQLPGTALLELQPVTGRTHQIRVHLASAGWPVVGDRVYGGGRKPRAVGPRLAERITSFPRQALHACRLTFEHPTEGRALSFEAELPQDMAALLEELRQSG
jgi:23S rRNA pseudouridine1911/1915/1917 synthase